jgi:acetyl-CoA C-acetyltransferase
VVWGCVSQVGEQSWNVARNAVLAAGWPESVPGTTLDRQCGSSQQALHFAAQAVASGTAELVIAGGVQNMSMVPIGSAMTVGEGFGFATPFEGSPGWQKRYGGEEISQFRAAELIARRWELSRPRLEAYALRSHLRAIEAIDAGGFDNEIVPVGDAAVDEGPRRDTSVAKMAALPPLVAGGRVSAATASQISDGASAVLVASGRAVRSFGLTPRARVHHLSARGADPVMMLTAPIPATAHALDRAGLRIGDIDLFEVNEAFASVVLAWLAETGADPERVNVHGGAIALGHPLGATGTKLCATLLNALERRGGRYGLQVMCEGGGQANVTILERLSAPGV